MTPMELVKTEADLRLLHGGAEFFAYLRELAMADCRFLYAYVTQDAGRQVIYASYSVRLEGVERVAKIYVERDCGGTCLRLHSLHER
jgi:hypothetical protein